MSIDEQIHELAVEHIENRREGVRWTLLAIVCFIAQWWTFFAGKDFKYTFAFIIMTFICFFVNGSIERRHQQIHIEHDELESRR